MNRNTFFAELRKSSCPVFGNSLSENQVRGVSGILDAFETHGDGRAKTLAYALATAYHETGKAMLPIKETVMPYHKDKNPSDAEVIRRLDNWARKIGRTTNIYWRPDPTTGKAYFGRGHVQLTWAENYRRSSADAGVDLVKNPDAMLDPTISACVLVRGLMDGRWNGKGKGIAAYLPENGPDNLRDARRTVNITDQWETIGGYYRAFLTAVKASGGVSRRLPIDLGLHFPEEPKTQKGSPLGVLLNLILKLIGRK